MSNLLPYYFKYIGGLLTSIGLFLATLYIWFDFKFSMPIFAIYSSFLETKIFATFKTNVADEFILIFCLTGLFLMLISKEKKETEKLTILRNKALWRAFIINYFILMFSILFIYGSGFIAILILNIFMFSIIYLIYFNYLKFKERKINA